MAKRKLLPVFLDQQEMLFYASNEEIGAALRAALAAICDDVQPELTGAAGMLCSMFRAQYARNSEDSENGGKGGRPPRGKTGVSENETGVSNIETKETDRQIDTFEIDIPFRQKETCGGAPSLVEIKDYFCSQQLRGDAERFFNYYVARGWKVKGESIADWRALARSWAANERGTPSKPTSGDKNAWMDEYTR